MKALAWFALTLLGSSAAAAVSPNYANVRIDRWQCRLCPFDVATAGRGDWRVGAMQVAEAQPRFGRDSGLVRAGGYLDAGVSASKTTAGGALLAFEGANLGIASRFAAFRYRGHRTAFRLERRDLPRNVAADGRTPYAGRTSLVLPGDWMPAYDAADMAVGERRVDHATMRRRSKADWRIRLAPEWDLRLDYRRETRRGSGETYADFLYQATGLPEPIDHQTDEYGMRLGYTGSRFLAAADWRSTRFRNGGQALEWQNPWLWPTATVGRKALAPDNQAQTFSLAWRADVAPRTVLHGQLAHTEARQTASFLPYTTNPTLPVPRLPAERLDGGVTTFAGTFSLVSQPTDRLRITAKRRFRQRDDATASLTLSPVVGDLYATLPVERRGLDLERAKTSLDVQYRLLPSIRLDVGTAADRRQRSPFEIAENEERRAWAAISVRHGAALKLRVETALGDRDASAFQHITANNPLTRRYYQAARLQRQWRASLDYAVPRTALSLRLHGDQSRNAYPHSVLGVTADRQREWGADVAWAPAASASMSAFFVRQGTRATTMGSDAYAAPDWRYSTADRVHSAGLTFDWRGLANGRIDFAASHVRSDGVGRYATRTEEWAAFPDLISDHQSTTVRLRYAWRQGRALLMRYRYDEYRASDWALAGAPALRNVLAFGRRSPSYANGLFSVSAESVF